MVFSGTAGKFQTVKKLVLSCEFSDNFQLVHFWFVTHGKKLEEMKFVDEELLYSKINKNDVYIWIMVCYGRYS